MLIKAHDYLNSCPKCIFFELIQDDRQIIPRILKEIKAARYEILLISPWFYHKEIEEALIQKVRSKISVKILTRPFNKNARFQDNDLHREALFNLDQAGVQVRGHEKIHLKLIIIDKNRVILTSKNMIESEAIDSAIVIKDHKWVHYFITEFYLLYNESICKYSNPAQYNETIKKWLLENGIS